jgi:hypothetical protein
MRKRVAGPNHRVVSKVTTDKDPVITVTGEIVLAPVLNAMDGVPLRAATGAYDPSFPDLIVQLFTKMLETSGSKRADTLTEDEFTKDLRKNAKPTEEQKKAGEPGKERLVRQEARKMKSMKWSFICAELPSLARFGRMVGVSRRQVDHWRARYPSFDEACEMCHDMLEAVIVQRSLTGQYDADFAKFLLKNWLGWKDRTEITGADGAPLNPPPELRLVTTEALEDYQRALLEAKQKLLQGVSPTT